MTLNGKTQVITGEASGLGAELARLARLPGATEIGANLPVDGGLAASYV